jgi:hypothetical protein
MVEAFSLRGLGRLAESWKQNPPFADDHAFGNAIADYRKNIIERAAAGCRSRITCGTSGLARDVRGMIVENQLDRGVGRIGGIEKLEEFDELSAAVAVSDQGMDLAGEQINPGPQAERAMAFVLMITREGRMHAGLRRQIRCRRCDRLDSWLFVAGDDRHRLARFLRLGGLFQDLNLAINAQHLGHLLLELGIATFQVVAHLVRLDFFLAENLAHRALDQIGDFRRPRPRQYLSGVLSSPQARGGRRRSWNQARYLLIFSRCAAGA